MSNQEEKDRVLAKLVEQQLKKEKDEIKEKNISVERTGKKIILPEGMSFKEAAEWCNRKQKEDEMEVRIDEVIDGYPLDAAYALFRAIVDKYGWNMMKTVNTFWGSNPPVMIGVPISPTENVQVPWGRYQIPNVEGYLESSIVQKDGRPMFCLGGVVKNKHKNDCASLAARAREILRESSIYKGKAITVEFPEDPEDFNPRDCPKFIDTSLVRPDELVFSEDLMKLVKANVFAPVEKTEMFRKHKIPLKIGVLLEGPYGTGKTLTAHVAAHKCEKNGWTFIYLKKTKDLAEAIHFAKNYQPAMVFAEDIDTIMKSGRDNAVNELLNTIDGVVTKNSEVVVVLTTNYINDIDQAMLRPGRLDAVLSIAAPDAIAVQKLIRLYGRNLIEPNEDLTAAGVRLQGQIPAVIREVVDRAKRIALVTNDNDEFKLTGSDLDITAKGMLNHLELLRPKGQDKRSVQEKSAQIVADGIMSAFKGLKEAEPSNGNGKHETKQLTLSSGVTPSTP